MRAGRIRPARAALLAVMMLAPGLARASADGDVPNPEARVEPVVERQVRPSGWTLGVGLGYKRLGPEWAPADHQFEFAVMDGAYRGPSWPLAFTLGIGVSVSAAVPRYAGVTADFCGTYEIWAGVRGEWPRRARTRAFAGAALAVVGASATDSDAISGFAPPGLTPVFEQENGAGPGVRVEAGVTRPLRGDMRLGLRGVWSRGWISLFGRRLDPGGAQVEALVLWGR